MAAFPVDSKRRWETEPRWRLFLSLNLTFGEPQAADLIKLNSLKPRISNWQGFTGYDVTGSELMFGVSAFPHADEKLSDLASDVAPHP
jgi:hypothetical protein